MRKIRKKTYRKEISIYSKLLIGSGIIFSISSIFFIVCSISLIYMSNDIGTNEEIIFAFILIYSFIIGSLMLGFYFIYMELCIINKKIHVIIKDDCIQYKGVFFSKSMKISDVKNVEYLTRKIGYVISLRDYEGYNPLKGKRLNIPTMYFGDEDIKMLLEFLKQKKIKI